MPRAIFNDRLMSHQYHLLDIDFSRAIPPWVLLPSAGFSSITAPEIEIDMQEVKEGTDPFTHHMMGKASTNAITLERGVSAFNSDFWRWITACLLGTPVANPLTSVGKKLPVPGKRRDLVLMHFTGISVDGIAQAMGQLGSSADAVKGGILAATGGLITKVADLLSSWSGGLIDTGITSIPGKVFLLLGCLPSGYRPASDFDAKSSEVSLESLTLSYHRFEEFSLLA